MMSLGSAAPLLARLGSAPLAFCMGERMPAERTTMRQVREVLRLRTAGVGRNEIARRVGVAPSTVRLTLKRLASAGLTWPLPAEMTDSALETALFAAAGTDLIARYPTVGRTNRSDPQAGSGLELIRWHRQKAGTIEHAHDVLMNELAGAALPWARLRQCSRGRS